MSSILTVSQLNRYLAFKLKEDIKLKNILIEGEISGFINHARTGHFYFTLKDNSSAIKVVMFNSFSARLKFMPENGMKVIVSGSIQVFERDGLYQLYATDIQPSGIGAQFLAFEQLKEKLAKEGLFSDIYKKPLPPFPSKIGIVTAKGGAALQDILNILGRRYPICEAIIFPCVVQGEYAVDSICNALAFADECECDVIICGRGGGSAEDLMAYNSEKVARTVFAMNTPVISAVGHETDTTIIDFTADLRAPTPSAAAELAVPDMNALNNAVCSCQSSLNNAFSLYISKKRQQIAAMEQEIKNYVPSASIAVLKGKTQAMSDRLLSAITLYLEKKQAEAASRAAKLDELSPLKIMSRGYSLVYKKDTLIYSSEQLSDGDRICVRFSDSQTEAIVCNTNSSP